MKVPGIWHKKTCKNLEFRTKNLEKTWNWYLEKSGNTGDVCCYFISLICTFWS